MFAAILPSDVCAANKDRIAGNGDHIATLIPNFSCVTDKIWRGAAPSNLALDELSKQGIKTIIDLRRGKHSVRREKCAAQKLGMTYVHLPMGYTEPSERDLAEFISIAQNPVYQPVYVHCRQGADRTGTVIAAYRILVQKWTLVHAYQEMRKHHFKPWLFPLRNKVRDIAAASQAGSV